MTKRLTTEQLTARCEQARYNVQVSLESKGAAGGKSASNWYSRECYYYKRLCASK